MVEGRDEVAELTLSFRLEARLSLSHRKKEVQVYVQVFEMSTAVSKIQLCQLKRYRD